MTRQKLYDTKISKNLPEYAQAARKTYFWAEQKGKQEEKNGSFVQASTVYCIATTVYAYVEWLLADAKNRNLKRLYFLARDGYQMLEVARIIKKRRNYDLELRYLYCSRYALQLPIFHSTEDYLDYICVGGKEVLLRQVLERGGLTQLEVETVLKEQGKTGDMHLSYQEIQNLKMELKKSEYFKECVFDHSEKAYDTCIAYLKQEGLFDSEPYGIVDSGWIGTMQAALQRLLRLAGSSTELEGYYFGLYDVPVYMDEKRYHTFYFSANGGYKRKMWFNNNLFEVIFSAPEGTTLGYEKEGMEYKPILGCEKMQTVSCSQQLPIIRKFAEELCLQPEAIQDTEALRRRLSRGIAEVLKEFMIYPSKEEAEQYGDIEFTDHVLDRETVVLAEPLTVKELRRNHLFFRYIQKRKGNYVPTSYWLAGTLMRIELRPIQVSWHRFWILAYKYAVYMKKDMIRAINKRKAGVNGYA